MANIPNASYHPATRILVEAQQAGDNTTLSKWDHARAAVDSGTPAPAPAAPSHFEQAAQAVMRPAAVAGRKDDTGKLDVTLFFDDLPHAIEAVTEVLQWAVTKKQPEPYERGSWQNVEDFSRRYRGALLRHQLNRAKDLKTRTFERTEEPLDAETGLMELAHIATDAMFLLEMAVRKIKGLPIPEGA